MATWMLILVAAAVLVGVIVVGALVWVLSGRAKPGGGINPLNDPGVRAGRGQSEHTQTHHLGGHGGM